MAQFCQMTIPFVETGLQIVIANSSVEGESKSGGGNSTTLYTTG